MTKFEVGIVFWQENCSRIKIIHYLPPCPCKESQCLADPVAVPHLKFRVREILVSLKYTSCLWFQSSSSIEVILVSKQGTQTTTKDSEMDSRNSRTMNNHGQGWKHLYLEWSHPWTVPSPFKGDREISRLITVKEIPQLPHSKAKTFHNNPTTGKPKNLTHPEDTWSLDRKRRW